MEKLVELSREPFEKYTRLLLEHVEKRLDRELSFQRIEATQSIFANLLAKKRSFPTAAWKVQNYIVLGMALESSMKLQDRPQEFLHCASENRGPSIRASLASWLISGQSE
jgi:hypothetical protein